MIILVYNKYLLRLRKNIFSNEKSKVILSLDLNLQLECSNHCLKYSWNCDMLDFFNSLISW